jgi:hypothetical protein
MTFSCDRQNFVLHLIWPDDHYRACFTRRFPLLFFTVFNYLLRSGAG